VADEEAEVAEAWPVLYFGVLSGVEDLAAEAEVLVEVEAEAEASVVLEAEALEEAEVGEVGKTVRSF
jgi:hypothetical protein